MLTGCLDAKHWTGVSIFNYNIGKGIVKKILLLVLFILLAGCGEAKKVPVEQPSFTDTRDGKTYKATKIGEQVWMAENLNYEVEGSRCYDNKPANCDKYGRLYDWVTAMEACPNGWHLPSQDEWEALIDFLGEDVAGSKLKTKFGWNRDWLERGKSGNGEDAYGFSALPGGVGSSSGKFGGVGKSGEWWSASEYGSDEANSYGMQYCNDNLGWGYDRKEGALFSVRCVGD
jgi:uncharacterized protein (TIGR02145 family)